MHKIVKATFVACVSGVLAFSLAACGNAGSSSSAASQEASAAEQQTTREDVEPILTKAAENTFGTVSFKTETETTATGASSNGGMQTQSINSTTTGQLDQSGDKPKVHMQYTAMSTMELGRTSYEMFVSSDNLIVKQNDQMFVDAMTDEMLNSYAGSITSIISADEISSMLDMASGYKLAEENGETTVSITIDTDKLVAAQGTAEASASAESASAAASDSAAESSNAAASDSAAASDAAAASETAAEPEQAQMPEGSEIASMVMSYTIGSDGRFKTVRIMSSTSGTPTYRVHQTYQFSDYDNTSLPEWPDLKAYVAEQSGVKTDENGRMYIEDGGQIFYVSEIGDDGMIYFDTSGTDTTGGGETYYYETPSTTPTDQGSTSNGDGGNGNGEEDRGRAYITADDGTIHFLDEEGSKLFENPDGSRYFIDADGNFYFLSE